MHALRKTILFIGLGIISIGIVGLAWSFWPAPRSISSLVLTPDLLELPGENGNPAIEGRRVQLDSPAWVRLGETAQVKLSVFPDPPGAARPAAGLNVEAESWLELHGGIFSPDGVTSTALLAGRPSELTWQVVPATDKSIEGRAWLAFRFLPGGNASSTRRPISAQPITISVVNILGLSLGDLHILAGLFIGCGFVLTIYSFHGRLEKKQKRR